MSDSRLVANRDIRWASVSRKLCKLRIKAELLARLQAISQVYCGLPWFRSRAIFGGPEHQSSDSWYEAGCGLGNHTNLAPLVLPLLRMQHGLVRRWSLFSLLQPTFPWGSSVTAPVVASTLTPDCSSTRNDPLTKHMKKPLYPFG